jgi:methyl-accepting chemotaxis protein
MSSRWTLPRGVFATLQARLRAGGALIVAIVLMGAAVAYSGLENISRDMQSRLDDLRHSSDLGSELESLILNQITAGERYLVTPDPRFVQQFADFGRTAHDQRRRYKELEGQTTEELQRITQVEQAHQRVEVEYALAHAQLDIGDRAGATARIEAVRPLTSSLQTDIRVISSQQADKVSAAAARLAAQADQRQRTLLLLTGVVFLITFGLIWLAMRQVQQPLETLQAAAERFGEGDLRTDMGAERAGMTREFAALAAAFDRMADQLRTIVGETVTTAERISNFASDLSSISEEVAASSGEVATAMVGIASGAEAQSQGLQATKTALEEVGQRSVEIAGASRMVNSLSEQISVVAARSRTEVGDALQRLLEIREVVTESAGRVTELEQASLQIDRFVETITGIARQTNLLALNAAIEAARAGEHGRGFAVVAEEVRKLAEGSARAAQEVAQNVQGIRGRIEEVVQTMERGTTKVADVEEVSRGADSALEQILAAVDGVRLAAGQVEEAADRNTAAMEGVDTALAEVSGTSESHAASAEEVSAAAEEQSAATEEMSASSSELLHAAERMRELVSGFRT